ncbi:uncharacterized protein LOC108088808 [Drosophila ficusphila]|uniref:uncharacterized protein LOC108088808 n=1 Tax=Drosophila ficusphila TaxID=30025 RepID=UPI0007E859F9|nr:uncharacterized protein LOC108088808 [Drosophila ficusphila]
MPVRLSSARSLNNKWIDFPPLHPAQPPRHVLRPARRAPNSPPHSPPNSPPNSPTNSPPNLPPNSPPKSPPLRSHRALKLPLPFRLLRVVLLILLLLLLGASPTACRYQNCSFLEGYILQYVCNSEYVENIRLQHKDRIPAIGTPYAIWRRSDSNDPNYLLISFYDSPLFSCYTVVMSDGQFYCDGHNFVEPNTEAAQLHCINFPFQYATDLYDACARTPCPANSPPLSTVIAYMKENIQRTNEAAPRLQRPAAVPFILPLLPFLLSRYFGILLCQ